MVRNSLRTLPSLASTTLPRTTNQNALIYLTLLAGSACALQPFAVPAGSNTDVIVYARQALTFGLVKNLRKGVAASPFSFTKE